MNSLLSLFLLLSATLLGCGPSGPRTPAYYGKDLHDRVLTVLPLHQVRTEWLGDDPADTAGLGLRLSQDFCGSFLQLADNVRIRCETASVDPVTRDTVVILDRTLRKNAYDSRGVKIQWGPRRRFPYVAPEWFTDRGVAPDFSLLIYEVHARRFASLSKDSLAVDLAYVLWDYQAGKVVLYGRESLGQKAGTMRGFRGLTDRLTVAMIMGSAFEGDRAYRYLFP